MHKDEFVLIIGLDHMVSLGLACGILMSLIGWVKEKIENLELFATFFHHHILSV